MNPCVSVSCSSQERGDRSSWVCGNSWDNAEAATAMSVGLENTRPFTGRVDWDWENPTPAANPSLLLSHQRFHHHHHEHSDSEDQKPQITPVAAPGSNMSFRQYGMGMGYSNHHHQNAIALLNSSGIRNFAASHDGIPSTSSFHPGLLYSDVSGFGASAYDSRSQLFGMMSLQEQHHKDGAATAGTIFHDIVKREDVCGGEFQTRIGLNLGQRTYFSSEDTAITRLYKRPRAIPSASQVPRCQAEGCNADLSNTKPYHRRHKVCEFHSKATSVITGGVQQRFCQQCSRFHVVSEFDEVKRSCRKRLADHNRRRRKPQPNAVVSAASSSAETHTTALKSEGENSIKSKPEAGAQVASVMRTESEGLMNAMSLPLMLQNSKGQINPNPNGNSNTSPSCNPNRNTPVLQHNSHKVSSSVPQHQYHGAQKGPNLSMGLCNQRQTSAAAQDYSGLELALPWLRPSNYSGGSSHHRSSNSPPMDILQPIISDKADVEGFSSPIQNFLPLTASNSRALGTTSQWMMGNSDNTEHQHMFSLLETPAVRSQDESNNQVPVEYLSHRRHQGGLNAKDTVEGQTNSTKFSDMQSMRPFGQSMYDASL